MSDQPLEPDRQGVACAAVICCAVLGACGLPIAPDAPAREPGVAVPTQLPLFFQEISWSPDGTRLALSAFHDEDYRLYVMNADGGELHAVTEGPWDLWSSWSPDGTRLALGCRREGNRDIYVVTPDGARKARLTDDPADDTAPSWSPDGRRIAFSSNRDGAWRIYTMRADGSGQSRLCDGAGDDHNPAWSPDGRQLAFFSTERGEDHVYVIDADGSNRRRVTRGVFPAWSPDGRRLLFDLDDTVYLIGVDGGEPAPLVTNGFSAEWSPDGSRIGFIRPIRREWPTPSDVYVIRPDGSGERRLTGGTVQHGAPRQGVPSSHLFVL